jgi:glycosyltransferase involved in cell wall biosynthesis
MELLIIDDSPQSNEDIIPKDDKRIRYIYLPEKIPLGKKRNMLNDMAKGEIIVCMDDDDYYSPDRVAHAVTKLQGSKALIAGSTVLHIYYPQFEGTGQPTIYRFGPYNSSHGTNATFCYYRQYLKTHRYLDDANKAEESHFTNKFTEPMIQLDPFKLMICLAHNNNTVEKTTFIPQGKPTNIKIKDFFKKGDKKMLEWIKELSTRMKS